MTDTVHTEEQEEYFDFDTSALGAAIANAPEAGFPKINFGRLKVQPMIVWKGPEVDPKSGRKVKHERPMRTAADKPNPDKGEATEIKFVVDIREFNPGLGFDYERRVRVMTTSRKAKADWDQIVLPSLIAVLGENWMQVAKGQPYVAVEDVPNINNRAAQETGKVYGVPKFITLYHNSSECAAAREAIFKGATGGPDSELTAVVDQVQKLMVAIGDEVELKKLLTEREPFNKYDPDELINLASL